MMRKSIIYSLIVLGVLVGIYCIPIVHNTIGYYLAPIDFDYIKKREWLSESGNIIRFDDGSNVLKEDTVCLEKRPYAIIKRLNKAANEIELFKFEKRESQIYTSTEEFTK